ncbi:MAG TPA: filamentous hemagglutinin N-terminal domain-containing protein [Dongiaceae bacterium]|nr:filamentous hemagglutinin N-terminal domain-containing protein [Dongiaceae bacterium]
MLNLHLGGGRVEFRWRRWRNKKRQEVSSCLMVVVGGLVVVGWGGAGLAGPTGGRITSGTGSIGYGGPVTTITQQSPVLTIDWQTFSTAANETVSFRQPGASALAINYVVGGVPSVLAGALEATGRVYILNSAGITFTGTSHVNVGALLATTAMTLEGDPTGSASFGGSGSGQVINRGSIQVSQGGFAILAAPYVENTGFIRADLGTVALAGTNKFTLDLRGDGLIRFVVPPEAVERIKADGARVGVNNAGTLQARSGQVLISASVATQVVNAAVNLSGVVDAGAFAANGQGGSVLVTSAGDLAIRGEVSAAGQGTGAGGAIITQAQGADRIEARARLGAAGGAAGGKGGEIEVSGHDVLMAGHIDPGSGGTLMIDPYNAVITAAPGHNDPAGSIISEGFISRQLKHDVSVEIQASHDILFNAPGGGHVLTGGDGNLTLDAGSDILFSAASYRIQTRGGDVTLAAGGSIGSPSHRLSIVSGSSKGGPGVDAAGNIVLTAGDNIYLGQITSKDHGKAAAAAFSASAGGDFSAAGPINVEAFAAGPGTQQANARVHITAGSDIVLHGLQDIATAHGVGHALAEADVELRAGSVTDAGDMSISAAVRGRSGHSFSADAELAASADRIQIDGQLDVTASADVSKGDLVIARAATLLEGADLRVTGAAEDEALASDHGVGAALASALVDMQAGASRALAGSISVASLLDRATADMHGSGSARALANTVLRASADLHVAGPVDVSADAHGNGAAHAGMPRSIVADGLLAASAGEDLDIEGDIRIHAKADGSSAGDIRAVGIATLAARRDATLAGSVAADAEASGSHVGNVLAQDVVTFAAGHDLVVDSGISLAATARGRFAGDILAEGILVAAAGGSQADATLAVGGNINLDANAAGSFAGNVSAGDILVAAAGAGRRGQATLAIDGDINLDAKADGSSVGDVSAKDVLVLAARSLAASSQGDANLAVGGDIKVSATVRGHAAGNMSAEDIASIAAGTASLSRGKATLMGDLDIDAQASGSDVGNVVAGLAANLTAGHDLTLGGDIGIDARAEASSAESARALADVTLQAGDRLRLAGDLRLSASAQGTGAGPASANAALALLSGGGIAVEGKLDIRAKADKAVAEWLTGSSGTAASGGAIVRVQIPP